MAISMTEVNFSQCNTCRHRQPYMKNLGAIHCDAFQDRQIPMEILRNEIDHTKPYPGDNGILFEAKD